MLAFFNGFLAQEAALAPAIPGVPAPAADGKIPLDTLAAPGRAKTAAANAPVEKPSFTTAQIAQFYADSSRGKYRGREAAVAWPCRSPAYKTITSPPPP